ncbi:protein FAM110C [Arapaima gigas]
MMQCELCTPPGLGFRNVYLRPDAAFSILVTFHVRSRRRLQTMHTNKGIDPTRILDKGPDYFRRQMDREREAKTRQRPSAVERLAASKHQYVRSQPPGDKTQQVVDRRPRMMESKQAPEISVICHKNSSDGSFKGSSSDRLRFSACQNAQPQRERFKKQRPDSLLMYRHKQEHVKGASIEGNRGNQTRRLCPSSIEERTLPPSGATQKQRLLMVSDNTCVGTQSQETQPDQAGAAKAVPNPSSAPELRPRRGVVRSHSDISSRYSRNVSEFETFFTYCGLDGDVIEALGRENFSARSDELELRVRSASTSTMEDGFSRRSDCSDGLHEDELSESARHSTSVVERNARIIKWLYSCKNAGEAGKALRELH